MKTTRKEWCLSYYLLFAPAILAGALLCVAFSVAFVGKVWYAAPDALGICLCLAASGWAMNQYTRRVAVQARNDAYIKLAEVLMQDAEAGVDMLDRIKEILRGA